MGITMNGRSVCSLLLCALGIVAGGASHAAEAAKPATGLQSFTQQSPDTLKTYDNQVKLFKYWTLARCGAAVSKKAGSDTLQEDWSNTAAAYLEYGSVPLEANEAAEALVQQFLATTRSGSTGGSYETMKCIDLFNSHELDALVARYIKK